jgi:hypothetical protein
MTIETGKRLQASDIQNLTFFPKGTILMYDGQLWDRTGGIPGWHICDGKDGTINLTDKFIRGGAAARQTGGTDVAEVPYHNHAFTSGATSSTSKTLKGNFWWLSGDSYGADEVFTYSDINYTEGSGAGDDTPAVKINMDATHSHNVTGTISYTGSQTADNRPVFCTVIFIEKIRAYLA